MAEIHIAILGLCVTMLGGIIAIVYKFAQLAQKVETLYEWWEETWKPTEHKETRGRYRTGKN